MLGCQVFVNALGKSIKHILNKYNKPQAISPDDIFIVNNPYCGGITHLNDAVLAMPIFCGNELVAWVVNIAHWIDIGGMSPGSISMEATELAQEGLQIPPLKIFAKGILNEELFEMICANSRLPEN